MDHVDWQINKGPLQCTRYMLEHEIDCDVNFKVGENQESIKAHKFVLGMRSPVFEKMLNGSYIEARQDPVIPDVEPDAFKALLRYCYYECVDIDEEDAFLVLCASKKYMLPLLEKASREKLIQSLSESNIWLLYRYALSVEDTQLRAGCRRYFQSGVTAVREALNGMGFLNIPFKVLLDLVEINETDHSTVISEKGELCYENDFGVRISEIELFSACEAWADAECLRRGLQPTGANKRTVLGDCLFLLRFPTMLFKELVNIVYPTGILTQEEKDDLCQYKHAESDDQCQLDFPTRSRRFMVVTSDTRSDNTTSSVFVKSKERLMLTKVWTQITGSYLVTVKDEGHQSSWSGRCSTLYETTSTDRYHLYVLDVEPQLLEAGVRYSVTIERIEESDDYFPDIPDTGHVKVGKLAAFKEVDMTRDPESGDAIYALTLSFV